jgi:hypothetical protein
MYPLTDGRHERGAHRSEDRSNVGLSQRSRGRPGGSPRESRVTVSPRFRPVKKTGPAVFLVRLDRQNSTSVRSMGSGHEVKDPTPNPASSGGDEGTRTPDPLLAKEVLSQLSYIPIGRADPIRARPVGQSQRKTTVRVPCRRTRCSTCQRTARARVTHSTSRPTRASSAVLWA